MSRVLGEFVLRGWGRAFPDGRLTNEELAVDLGIDAASITARTGVLERRVARDGETASSLGGSAARAALALAGFDPAALELLLLSTYTPDHLLCPTGPKIAHDIGALRAGAFDLNGACSGGVTALLTASSLLTTGVFRNALVVASDLTSLYVRRDDPKTRLVFGDGAAALLLERPTETNGRAWQVRGATVGADGEGASMFHVPAGGSAIPPLDGAAYPNPERTVSMNGRAIFRFGVEKGATLIRRLCDVADVDPARVRWVVPHQANLRIISALIEKTAIPADRWFVNIEHLGNTASASVPLALTDLLDQRAIEPGDIVLLVAFGAGLTWSGLALVAG